MLCPHSLNACNLHLTNSVGHKVNDEKNAAKNPENALSNVESHLSLPFNSAINFWQKPYAQNKTLKIEWIYKWVIIVLSY